MWTFNEPSIGKISYIHVKSEGRVHIMSLAFAYYFPTQFFQNKTQEVSSFCLGWLSSEDDDEWLTSSIQSEFMKEFYVEEV